MVSIRVTVGPKPRPNPQSSLSSLLSFKDLLAKAPTATQRYIAIGILEVQPLPGSEELIKARNGRFGDLSIAANGIQIVSE